MMPFHRLGTEQLREALGLAEVRRFHLLLSGHIRFVRLTAQGDQIIVLHVQAGHMFGIGTVRSQATHQTTAITADRCLVLSWPNSLWPAFSARYDGFVAETLRAFGARADEMSTRIVEQSTKLVEQRIACALLRMIGQSVRKVAGGVEIGFPVTRQNIADMTGTTLHTVSRILSMWERQGILKSTRCLIMVRDPHRLVMLSGTVVGGAPEGGNTRLPDLQPYTSALITAV
ncbi:Crp/Fnr family transcriptional regulator [Tabrizicola sp. WMC-M-20]|nr:Crp/Fnr family transcriptional regulator [Tabrizicola sp. WMC-M-20]